MTQTQNAASCTLLNESDFFTKHSDRTQTGIHSVKQLQSPRREDKEAILEEGEVKAKKIRRRLRRKSRKVSLNPYEATGMEYVQRAINLRPHRASIPKQ